MSGHVSMKTYMINSVTFPGVKRPAMISCPPTYTHKTVLKPISRAVVGEKRASTLVNAKDFDLYTSLSAVNRLAESSSRAKAFKTLIPEKASCTKVNEDDITNRISIQSAKNDSYLNKLIEFKLAHPGKKFIVSICYTHSIYNAYYTREFFEYLDSLGLLDLFSGLDNVMLNYSFGDINSPSILPDFAKKELKQKRIDDLESPVMQKVFTKFPLLRNDFNQIHEILTHTPDFTFDEFIKHANRDPGNPMETSLPWLASVIERYKNQ